MRHRQVETTPLTLCKVFRTCEVQQSDLGAARHRECPAGGGGRRALAQPERGRARGLLPPHVPARRERGACRAVAGALPSQSQDAPRRWDVARIENLGQVLCLRSIAPRDQGAGKSAQKKYRINAKIQEQYNFNEERTNWKSIKTNEISMQNQSEINANAVAKKCTFPRGAQPSAHAPSGPAAHHADPLRPPCAGQTEPGRAFGHLR